MEMVPCAYDPPWLVQTPTRNILSTQERVAEEVASFIFSSLCLHREKYMKYLKMRWGGKWLWELIKQSWNDCSLTMFSLRSSWKKRATEWVRNEREIYARPKLKLYILVTRSVFSFIVLPLWFLQKKILWRSSPFFVPSKLFHLFFLQFFFILFTRILSWFGNGERGWFN